MKVVALVSLVALCVVLGGCSQDSGSEPPSARPPGSQPGPPQFPPVPPDPEPDPGQYASVQVLQEFSTRTPVAGRFVVTTAKQLQFLMRSAHGEAGDVPAVSFQEQVVLAATMGMCRTGGYSIRIQAVRYDRSQGRLVAYVVSRRPGPGEMVTQALTAPGHAVVVPRLTTRVEWVEVGQTESPTPVTPSAEPTPADPEPAPSDDPPPDTSNDLDFEI